MVKRRDCASPTSFYQPSEGGSIFFNCHGLYHMSLDSDERLYQSTTSTMRFDPALRAETETENTKAVLASLMVTFGGQVPPPTILLPDPKRGLNRLCQLP